MNDPPNKIVPDYAAPTPRPRRPICAFAAASIILPMLWILVTGINGNYIETADLDDRLGFSAYGMFYTKLALFGTLPLLCIPLAVWSFFRIHRTPRLYGYSVAATGIALNIYLFINLTNTIYHLYSGYFH